MAEEIIKVKVSQLPQVGNINDFEVLGVDKSSNKSARATMPQLRGNTGAKGEKGDKGETGLTGPKGDKGDTGATGPANKLSIGTVSSGATAGASIAGTAPNQTLSLTLPKGDKGDKGDKGETGAKGDTGLIGPANSLAIGTVQSGASPGADITGTAPNQILNLVLQKGDKGDTGSKGDTGGQGIQGIQGPKGDTGNTGAKGEKGDKGDPGQGLPTGGTTGQQLVKKSATNYDYEWQTPAGAGDMLKSIYDTNGNGIVDNAEKVNGLTVETAVPAGAKFTDTTYSEITEAEINTGTASALRTITARRVAFILSKVLTLISNAISALTKNDVGLGNLDNIQQATKAEFNTHDADGTRHITAGERTAWGAKWDYNESTIKAVKVNNAANADTVNGKTVAENVPAGAKFTDTVYTHPTGSGNNHVPAGGASGQILRYSAAGIAAWGAENNTTYSPATQSANGLMSAADKTKLNGVEAGANNYTLPAATDTVLGGIKSSVVTVMPASPIAGVLYLVKE